MQAAIWAGGDKVKDASGDDLATLDDFRGWKERQREIERRRAAPPPGMPPAALHKGGEGKEKRLMERLRENGVTLHG